MITYVSCTLGFLRTIGLTFFSDESVDFAAQTLTSPFGNTLTSKQGTPSKPGLSSISPANNNRNFSSEFINFRLYFHYFWNEVTYSLRLRVE